LSTNNNKMKTYNGNWAYRGYSYDFSMNAKSFRDVAEKLGCSLYVAKNYFSIGMKKHIDGIIVTPYGFNSRMAIGHTNEMTLEEFKKAIDNNTKK